MNPVTRRSMLALALIGLAACPSGQATVLVVQVTGKPGTYSPTTLDVSLTPQSGSAERTLLTKGGQPITLPTSFVIRADGWSGPATLAIKAKDDKDRLLGEGQTGVSIVPDEEVGFTVEIFPADFSANDRYQASQFFSTQASARQLSSDGKGNVVGVWEDQECPLGRCDVYYRMFDANAQPKLNGVTNKTEEHVANEANATYDMPAVAMQSDGSFVLAWYRADSSSSTYDICSRTFLANGRPDDQSDSGHEIVLSASGATNLGVPDVAALTDKNYVVVWHQVKNNNWQVMGRFLGPHGVPTKPGVGVNEPFLVAEFANAGNPVLPNPAVAPGPNKGFMVTWRHDQAKLWGRSYNALAVPNIAAFSVSGTSKVGGFDVGPRLDGYAVVWEDSQVCATDSAPPCIRFRRYNLVGAALETPWTVNTTGAGKQQQPAVAMRGDGSMLVAWTSTTDGTQDNDGGIRGRRVLSVGLPMGDDYPLNTTTTQVQDTPSLAAFNTDSFFVLFRDDSQLGPDTDQAGIRGRVLYASYSVSDGKIGALCDTNSPCVTGFKCINSGVGNRCLRTCDAKKPDCPDGGKCETLSGGFGDICMYK